MRGFLLKRDSPDETWSFDWLFRRANGLAGRTHPAGGKLGYDSVWTAEAYGSDAITPLAYLAAITKRIKLGTGNHPGLGPYARQLRDEHGNGRCPCRRRARIAGLGVSGPQIVEGWYGQPWGKPYYWLKDYAAIMRKIWQREEGLTHDGKQLQLPYTGEGGLGVGKPLKSILHMNPDIPIYFGSGNEATVRLTGEIADGWLPLGFMPGTMDEYKPWLEEGFKRAGNGKGWNNFEIQARVFVDVDEDVKASIDRLKPREALYIGGMGHKDKNFHKDMFIRRGYKDEADRIQELYLAGHKEEAIATIPDEWIDSRGLMGPPDRIKQRFKAWEDLVPPVSRLPRRKTPPST